MSKKTEQISNLIAPALETMGYALWGCEWIGQGAHSLLRVYIEKENGVTAEDCVLASRQIGAILDVEECITGSYHLEVSSPGLTRTLFRQDQYEKYIGKKIRLTVRTPQSGTVRRQFSGVLTAVVGEKVTVNVEEQLIEFDLNNIEKAVIELI